jgi:hypothetical protein
LDEVVHLCARANGRSTKLPPINTRVGADFDPVVNDHGADVRHFHQAVALWIWSIAEAISADRHVLMKDDAPAESAAVPYDGIRVNDRAGTDDDVWIDSRSSVQHNGIADLTSCIDTDMGSDANLPPESGAGVNECSRVNPHLRHRLRRLERLKQLDHRDFSVRHEDQRPQRVAVQIPWVKTVIDNGRSSLGSIPIARKLRRRNESDLLGRRIIKRIDAPDQYIAIAAQLALDTSCQLFDCKFW